MTRPPLETNHSKRIAIIGGGLAGLAAAWGLSKHPFHIDLFEAKRRSGGRAGSFIDPVTKAEVDYCQHVAMGCCTNFRKLIEETELEGSFEVSKELTFLKQNSPPSRFRRRRFLPTPLDLAPDFLLLHFLPWREKLQISRAMAALMRPGRVSPNETMGDWLVRHGQSPQSIRDFWNIILASALGEKVEKVAFAPARKVFVDGFLATPEASEILIPQVPLSELFGIQLPQKLAERGVRLHFNSPVRNIDRCNEGKLVVDRPMSARDSQEPYDAVIIAVPWHSVERLFTSPEAQQWIPNLTQFARFQTSPISGIHLWFETRPTPLPHAVIIDRLSQWIFQPTPNASTKGIEFTPEANEHRAGSYVQVVVSASHDLRGRDHQEILKEVVDDFNQLLPSQGKGHGHNLRHGRVVTDPNAVFSITPQSEALRPTTQTKLPGLFLAGDWVQTGWPATMEGAIKSGFQAAEGVLELFGSPRRIVAPSLNCRPIVRFLTT